MSAMGSFVPSRHASTRTAYAAVQASSVLPACANPTALRMPRMRRIAEHVIGHFARLMAYTASPHPVPMLEFQLLPAPHLRLLLLILSHPFLIVRRPCFPPSKPCHTISNRSFSILSSTAQQLGWKTRMLDHSERHRRLKHLVLPARLSSRRPALFHRFLQRSQLAVSALQWRLHPSGLQHLYRSHPRVLRRLHKPAGDPHLHSPSPRFGAVPLLLQRRA